MSDLQELVGEWRRRKAAECGQFRKLTNVLTERAFGMDVNACRRYKNRTRPAEDLRDRVTDLELVLTFAG